MSSSSRLVRSWDRAMRLLRDYHSYRVVGLEHFPQSGPVLVASTHSLATYENFLLNSVSIEVFGRRAYVLGDDLLFRIPVVGDALREMGVVPGKRKAAIELLERGEIVGLGPGGMRESLRSSRQKYQFDWDGRMGFVWVAMSVGAPIVLAACPGADDIFTVYETPITTFVYQQLRVPLPLFRGIGPTFLPRPAPLVHVLSKPIYSDVAPDRVTREDVERHHAYLTSRMHQLMQDAVAIGPNSGSG